MTKEERAEKWFLNIPNARSINMETKIEVCSKAARKMAIIFFAVFTVECALIFIVTGGEIFDSMADFMNNISKESYTGNHHKGVALVGGLLCLPFIALPIIAAVIFKNKWIRSEISKTEYHKDAGTSLVTEIARTEKTSHESVNYKMKECTGEVLEFENFNFKLAIIQVLMYELEILEPYFDICDFAVQYAEKKIDTDSMVIIQPALNFFEKLPIPKRLAMQVEEINMDGGNDIYMNIIPQWDGEDGCFDLNEVSLSELRQFPNLKKATIMSNAYDKVKEIFDIANIEVELL